MGLRRCDSGRGGGGVEGLGLGSGWHGKNVGYTMNVDV